MAKKVKLKRGRTGEIRKWEPGVMDSIKYGLASMFGDDRAAVQNAEKVMSGAEWLPGVGDAMAMGEAKDEFDKGNYWTAGGLGTLAAIGLIPGAGDVAAKAGKKGIKKLTDAIDAGKLDEIPDWQQRGDSLLNLIKTRPHLVTDEMLDMGDPTKNANLNAYLFENYDLPMDEKSRMQRMWDSGSESGPLTNMYHGTAEDIQAFDKSKAGGATEAESAKRAFWATNEPDVADAYAENAMEHRNLRESWDVPEHKVYAALQEEKHQVWKDAIERIRKENPDIDYTQAMARARAEVASEYERLDPLISQARLDFYDANQPEAVKAATAEREALIESWADAVIEGSPGTPRDIAREIAIEELPNHQEWKDVNLKLAQAHADWDTDLNGQNIMPLTARGNYSYQDMKGMSYGEVPDFSLSKEIDEAKAAGYDGLHLGNFEDTPNRDYTPADHLAVPTENANKFRSKHARFDPRLKHLRNLMASGAPAGAGLMGLMGYNVYNQDGEEVY